ncbi:Adaptive-response sensory-kinase SasA [Neobacillus rhizosphaerae]|uniref:histidine kinase n=1 Tax=Neobacillus rhizosphaerae TaxID=2880965 RepID=A0ABM9EVB5_9BACI|nr:ATP-binding protein [Neobacillus rhizosphaerae]CAH2716161.1 Adaptive-response sensory-kinase SasA [Neobacillus rhizosphaerae]
MKVSSKSPKLIFEEKKAIKLFLWLFYIFFFSFDFLYYYILPLFSELGDKKFLQQGLGYWVFIVIIGLLPISVYLIRKRNPYHVKYFFLLTYIIIDIIDNLIRYYGTSHKFASGNIVELLFIFFSPIFVNRKYFWTATIAVIGKYLFLGMVLHDPEVLPPALIIGIVAAIAFIILIRFYSYINSITSVHEELHQKEKLAVIGQMAAAIGHEIRNPLSSLKGFTQLQQERHPNGNNFYPIMIQEIDRINSIVNDLMYLGKPRDIKFEKASIEEIIAYTLSITQQQVDREGVTVETIIAGPLPPIDCEEKQLKQVFINLIKNAIEAMPNGGQIKIKVKVSAEGKLSISIEDEGYGISEENIANLVEPFFTTKKDGTGLGLMVTSQIIKDHNGELKIDSNIGKGTKVHVTLPLTQKI